MAVSTKSWLFNWLLTLVLSGLLGFIMDSYMNPVREDVFYFLLFPFFLCVKFVLTGIMETILYYFQQGLNKANLSVSRYYSLQMLCQVILLFLFRAVYSGMFNMGDSALYYGATSLVIWNLYFLDKLRLRSGEEKNHPGTNEPG